MIAKSLSCSSLQRLALAGLAAIAGVTAVSDARAAAYATGGTGAYRNEILWLTWGGGTNGTADVAMANNSQTTANFLVSQGQRMIVTCTLSNVGGTGALTSYRPGGYSGDALDDMYNIGGTGASNTLIAGLITANSSTATFRVTCTATLNGSAYSIPGLVMADAESLETGVTNGTPDEYLTATADGTWQIAEMNRVTGRNYYAIDTASGSNRALRFGPGGQGSGTSPAAIGFMTFANSAYTGATRAVAMDFAMKGGGRTAMAIGLLVPRADFGDAPSTYGIASHLFYAFTPGVNSPALSATQTNINSTTFSLGGLSPLTTDLLGTVGPDGEAATSTPAGTGDEAYGIAGSNEEDAWALTPALSTALSGNTLTRSVACVGTGTVAGWIDFDGNGTFDTDERASSTCSGGTASLSWSVPTDIVAGTSYVRLRYATTASDVLLPTGSALSGEVEDRQIQITAGANLRITKTNTPGVNNNNVDQSNDTVTSGATTTYTVTVTNDGPAAAVGPVVRDTPTGALTCPSANVVTCTSATSGACPSSGLTVATLTSTGGLTLGTLPNAASVALSFSCTVN